MIKALDPVSDAQFNQLHPRAKAGTMGLRPGQFAPKSEAEKMQDEAEKNAEQEIAPQDPAQSTQVETGTNEQDAEVAVAADHADNLREKKPKPQPGAMAKSTVEAAPVANLIVVFDSRADATKFAIACDHACQNAAHTAVTAAANGRYHVNPEGLTPVEIDCLQQMIHMGVPLSEMSLPMNADATDEDEPMEEAEETMVDPADADNSAIMAGVEESGREYLQDAVNSGRVTPETVGEVLAIARALMGLSDTRDNGFLPVSEALHYGSVAGLKAAAEGADLEMALRAQAILDQMGLMKGVSMDRPALLVPVKNGSKHDSLDYTSKAEALGTDEQVTKKVGSKEDITEDTAKYPKTGHKQARRPRLILRGTSKDTTLQTQDGQIGINTEKP